LLIIIGFVLASLFSLRRGMLAIYGNGFCSWKAIKYKSFGPFGFIGAEKFLEKIKPEQLSNL